MRGSGEIPGILSSFKEKDGMLRKFHVITWEFKQYQANQGLRKYFACKGSYVGNSLPLVTLYLLVWGLDTLVG